MEVCASAPVHGGRVKTGAWINGSSACSDTYLKPIYKHGEVILEVECGENKGLLYLSRLCQGSRGPCIYFGNSFLTPNEFQYVSGRETAKDWKRSIRHHGKSIKLLLSKGLLCVHPTVCDCVGCKTNGHMGKTRSTGKRDTHKEFRYDVVFPTNEPIVASDAASSDKEEKDSDTTMPSPQKNHAQRTGKLSRIIETLRTSREKENFDRVEQSDGVRDRVEYSAQVRFQDMRRSPSTSPNLVYTPTIEQLNWTAGFNKLSAPRKRPPHKSPWKRPVSPSWMDRSLLKRPHDDVVPLDLSLKKQRYEHMNDGKCQRATRSDSFSSEDGSSRTDDVRLDSPHQYTEFKTADRCQSLLVSPPSPNDWYPLKIPSLQGLNIIGKAATKPHSSANDSNTQINGNELEVIKKPFDKGDNGPSSTGTECSSGTVNYAMDNWTIDDVKRFVLKICGDDQIVQELSKQHVDGKSLRLLTVDHLVGVLAMKLGPAVRLCAEISKQCGKCEICHHCLHCHGGSEEKS